jgi:hypothetical protein
MFKECISKDHKCRDLNHLRRRGLPAALLPAPERAGPHHKTSKRTAVRMKPLTSSSGIAS